MTDSLARLSAPSAGTSSDVLAALSERFPEGASAREVALSLGRSRTRVAETLAALERAGTVEKRGGRSGKYVVLDACAAAPLVRQAGAPQGWESPKINLDGEAGTAYTGVTDQADPDEADLFKIWNLDPDKWQIDGPLGVSAWQSFSGGWLYAYKARLRRRSVVATEIRQDVEDLIAEVRRSSRRRTAAERLPEATDSAFAIFLSDWQIGKGEGGGTPATIARLKDTLRRIEDRVYRLRKMGKPLGTCYVAGLGDLFEGTCGFYAMQEWQTDLDRRSQARVIRDLLFRFIDRLARLFSRVIVGTVAGNHGENRDRQSGKAFSTFADNDDVAIFEQVAFALDVAPQTYGHVSFVVPDTELSLCLDMAGTRVGIVHGHQFTKGSTPQQKAVEWWKGQMLGEKAVGQAQILVSAHFHHFSVVNHGPRWAFQTPAMDGGSTWFDNTTGMGQSPTGTLTFTVSPGGWDDLAIL